jgi:hypothetical protein
MRTCKDAAIRISAIFRTGTSLGMNTCYIDMMEGRRGVTRNVWIFG